jgi:phospholipid transport system substrate-binding protein
MLYISDICALYIRCLFVGICLLPVTIPAQADEFPATTTIERLQQGLIDIDRRHAALNDFPERVADFAPLIESSHDLPYMARMTIKRYWPTLDGADRELFRQEFSALSIETYASRFRDLGEVRFLIEEQRIMSNGRIEVRTRLTDSSGKTTAINYVLHETETGWMIINILAEGVSDLALKRSQYQQILATRSFDELLRYITAQRADIAREN